MRMQAIYEWWLKSDGSSTDGWWLPRVTGNRRLAAVAVGMMMAAALVADGHLLVIKEHEAAAGVPEAERPAAVRRESERPAMRVATAGSETTYARCGPQQPLDSVVHFETPTGRQGQPRARQLLRSPGVLIQLILASEREA